MHKYIEMFLITPDKYDSLLMDFIKFYRPIIVIQKHCSPSEEPHFIPLSLSGKYKTPVRKSSGGLPGLRKLKESERDASAGVRRSPHHMRKERKKQNTPTLRRFRSRGPTSKKVQYGSKGPIWVKSPNGLRGPWRVKSSN